MLYYLVKRLPLSAPRSGNHEEKRGDINHDQRGKIHPNRLPLWGKQKSNYLQEKKKDAIPDISSELIYNFFPVKLFFSGGERKEIFMTTGSFSQKG